VTLHLADIHNGGDRHELRGQGEAFVNGERRGPRSHFTERKGARRGQRWRAACGQGLPDPRDRFRRDRSVQGYESGGGCQYRQWGGKASVANPNRSRHGLEEIARTNVRGYREGQAPYESVLAGGRQLGDCPRRGSTVRAGSQGPRTPSRARPIEHCRQSPDERGGQGPFHPRMWVADYRKGGMTRGGKGTGSLDISRV
jgi:hypothetical protein